MAAADGHYKMSDLQPLSASTNTAIYTLGRSIRMREELLASAEVQAMAGGTYDLLDVINTDLVMTHMRLGRVYEALGRRDAAKRHFDITLARAGTGHWAKNGYDSIDKLKQYMKALDETTSSQRILRPGHH